jgi:predicted DNA-binding transcriptional regulator AlpA
MWMFSGKRNPERIAPVKPAAQVEPPPFMGRPEVCRQVGLSERLLNQMVIEKKFPAPVMFGARPRWRRADVEAFINGK